MAHGHNTRPLPENIPWGLVLYDSLDDADPDDDDDKEYEEPQRVVVFVTRRNIQLLCKSSVWFLDGTFKTSP